MNAIGQPISRLEGRLKTTGAELEVLARACLCFGTRLVVRKTPPKRPGHQDPFNYLPLRISDFEA